MSKELSSRNRRLMTIAAIGLCCAVSQAFAGSGGLLPGVQTAPGISAAQVLPAVSNPRPYRQVVFANCDTTVSGSGVPYGCVVRLDVITTGHLLQIDNINCGGINFNAEAADSLQHSPEDGRRSSRCLLAGRSRKQRHRSRPVLFQPRGKTENSSWPAPAQPTRHSVRSPARSGPRIRRLLREPPAPCGVIPVPPAGRRRRACRRIWPLRPSRRAAAGRQIGSRVRRRPFRR